MRRIVAICFIAYTGFVGASDFSSPAHQLTSAPPNARFEILASPLAAKWTFRLDRYTGRIWQLVTNRDDENTWEEMEVIRLPKAKTAARPRFQLFTSGLAARHTFLTDNDTGKTWVLASGKVTNSDGTESDVTGWQPFAE